MKISVLRNNYNAIVDGYCRDFLNTAIKNNMLPAEYVDVDKKHRGSALNYSFYDFNKKSILVQKRNTTCTKYGNSPQVDYYLITKKGRSVVVFELKNEKHLVQRRAKACLFAGELIKSLNIKMD